MPVNTGSKSYRDMIDKWERSRDAYDGQDAVKSKNDKYLPLLDSHAGVGDKKYVAYRDRATFYNATARTVDGLAGAVFQKAPEITASLAVKSHAADITLTDEPLDVFALKAEREVILMGRYGILVDWSASAERPYWAGYRAEDIFETKTERRDGDQVIVRVVLRENVEESIAEDEFGSKAVEQFRVLELVDGVAVRTIFRWDSESKKFIGGESVILTRNSQPLAFIPFVPLGPLGVSARIAKPPMLDLVDVNLSHYRTSADLEHGRHKLAVPQPWVSGVKPEGKLLMGGENAWMLPSKDAKAGILEFNGQGLGELRNADEEKRAKMSILGARLLEDQPGAKQNETAAAVGMRHAGEQATLRTITNSVAAGLTLALQWHSWWFERTASTPADTGAMVTLNKDFSGVRMDPQEMLAIAKLVELKVISHATAYHNLERGDRTRPGVTAEQELAEISSQSGVGPPEISPNMETQNFA